jgi:hypothetical protein
MGGFAMMPVAMMGWERLFEKGAAVVGRERKGEM